MNDFSAQQLIFQMVYAIPEGRVATYGQIAQLAGLGRGARQVGSVLKHLPKDTSLPWHRVVNAAGKISLSEDSVGYVTQRQRLIAEGVVFCGNKIVLKQFQWQP